MKASKYLVLALACVVIFCGTVFAQEVTRGAISVRVEDPTGAVIPGATVKLVANVQPELTASTGSRGEVLFSNLIPANDYKLTVSSTGFKTAIVEDISLRLNETRPVTVTLEPGAVVETVEVTGGAGGIDLESTTSGGSVDDTLYETVPVQRGITSSFAYAPGVSSGGGTCSGVIGGGETATGTCSNPSIGGASGFENLYLIDGVNVTQGGYGTFGAYNGIFGSVGSGTTTAFIKEVQVKTGGYDAQYGEALGGIVNVVTKTGGNSLHGSAWGYYAPRSLEATRKQANAFRVKNYQAFEIHGLTDIDFGAELSGRIIENRLFFYGSLNPTITRTAQTAPQVPGGVFTYGPGGVADLGVHEIVQRTINYAGKLTGQLTPNHRVEASLFGDPTIRAYGPNRTMQGDLDPVTGLPADFSRLDFSSLNLALRYNGVINPNWLVNASYSNNHTRFEEQRLLNAYQVTDETAAVRTFYGGAGFLQNDISDGKRINIDNTNIIDAGILGQHELTFGFTFDDNNFSGIRRRTGPDFPVVSDALVVRPQDVGINNFGATFRLFSCMKETGTADCYGQAPLAFQGASDAFYAYQTRGSFFGAEFTTISRYAAAYGQDDWRVNKYLTLKLGLRWEQEELIGNTGVSYTYTGSWGPRLGAILDPFGTRKTKISFHFARFFQKLPNDLSVRAFSGEQSYLNLQYWVEPDKVIRPDQSHYIGMNVPNGGSCPVDTDGDGVADATTNAYICAPVGDAVHPEGGAVSTSPTLSGSPAGVPPIPGTKATFQDEFGIGIKHEIGNSGIVVGGRYVDRRLKRITEDGNAVSFENVFTLFNIPFILMNPSASADLFINPVQIQNPGSIVGQPVVASDPDGIPNSGDEVLTAPPAGTCYSGSLVTTTSGGNITSAFCYTPDSGDPGQDGQADGFPNPVREYQAVEITFERRMRDNWQFFANWRIARLRGNFEGAFRNDNGQSDPGITSLFDFINSPGILDTYKVGILPNDRTHVVNAYGSYMFNDGPVNGLNIGMGLRVSSGKPTTELLAHPLFDNAGEVVCNPDLKTVTDVTGAFIYSTGTRAAGCEGVGRGGLGKTPVTGTVDLHLDYPVRISETFTLKGAVDLFNVFNATRYQNIREFAESSAGVVDPDFKTPLAFQRPFNMRMSLRLEW